MKFQDYLYERPNVDLLKENLNDLTKKVENAKSFEEVDNAIQEYILLDNEYSSMATLVSIRNSIKD